MSPSRFDKTVEKVNARRALLDDVNRNLDVYLVHSHSFEEWFAEVEEVLDSADSSRLDGDALTSRMTEIARSRDQRTRDFDQMLKIGRELVNKKDVTDTQPVKDQMKVSQ